MQEVICRFSKGEEVKWVSHLETMRMLERALRRAEIPLDYTQGFNPHPRLAMGPALPAGMTSEAELVGVFLAQKMDAEEFKEKLAEQLPPTFTLQAVWSIPAFKKKQTLGDIDTAEYVAQVRGELEAEELERRAVGLLSCSEIRLTRQREKKTQEIDLRPWILALAVSEKDGGAEIRMTLHTGSRGGARPQEVLEQLGVGGPGWEVKCHRQALYASPPQSAKPSPKGPLLRSLHGSNANHRRRKFQSK